MDRDPSGKQLMQQSEDGVDERAGRVGERSDGRQAGGLEPVTHTRLVGKQVSSGLGHRHKC